MSRTRSFLTAALALAAAGAQAQSPQAVRPADAQRSLEPITVTARAARAHDPFSPFVYEVMGLNAPIRIDIVRGWFQRDTAAAPEPRAASAAEEQLRTAQAQPARR
jgi:hypothetical protein